VTRHHEAVTSLDSIRTSSNPSRCNRDFNDLSLITPLFLQCLDLATKANIGYGSTVDDFAKNTIQTGENRYVMSSTLTCRRWGDVYSIDMLYEMKVGRTVSYVGVCGLICIPRSVNP